MRNLSESLHGMVDLGVVLMIGVAFVGLILVAYIIFALKTQFTATIPAYIAYVKPNILDPGGLGALNATYNSTWNTYSQGWFNSYGGILNNTNAITGGFDNTVALILVAITIWILAIAISALLILRGRQE
jgi:multisubunit Na+/H+ antiporter MnhB subunit